MKLWLCIKRLSLSALLFIGSNIVSATDSKFDKISPENPVIVLPENADGSKEFAAKELKKHWELITGSNIEIIKSAKVLPEKTFPIYIGKVPPADSDILQKEEARYSIGASGIYIYGEDNDTNPKINFSEILDFKHIRTGTLFAVYFFLENEMGVKWIEPGDWGIVYKQVKKPDFAARTFSWTPQLKQRYMRPDSEWKSTASGKNVLPQKMEYSKKNAEAKDLDQKIWLRRMRMGTSIVMDYGHAFTSWWTKYGKSHPDFFALVSETGKREPYSLGGRPDRIKLCVTNKELQNTIVKNWLEDRQKNANAAETINLCENDSDGYCSCPECIKLDVRKDGEAFGTHMTDRYIWFANQIVKIAREKVPDAKVVMYAYAACVEAPRREKISDGIILGFVPTCLSTNEELNANYQKWRAAGAKDMFLRPNDNYLNPGLPIGYDQKMFESFKVGIGNGIIGTDYDSLHGFWEISGLGNYALAKGSIYPERNFDYWEDEYCSAFGTAKNSMKEYLTYWRKIWDEKIYPDRKEIAEIGRYGNFRRGLMWRLTEYLSCSDFDRTDSILQNISMDSLSENEKGRLEKIKLANRHSRLMLLAITSLSNKKASSQEKLEASRNLLNFRVVNRDKLNICWPLLFDIEKEFGDISGISWSEQFGDHTEICGSSLKWRFKIDEQNVGISESWYNTRWDEINSKWNLIDTNKAWETQAGLPEDLRGKLKSYDGIGWYAARIPADAKYQDATVYLVFGAVDESCWIYVNGKKVGEHVFQKDDDWKSPFKIRIDNAFTSEPHQIVTVRVEDKTGMGGIWKPVWLAIEKR